MKEQVVIYMTAPNSFEAEKIAKTLIEERLVACVNIFSNVKSVFKWQEEVKIEDEIIFIAKSRKSLVELVISRVKTLHSYECPCIVVMPIIEGNQDFLAWIDSETQAKNLSKIKI